MTHHENLLQEHPRPEILIIGGSLSGLTLALACANRGICTRVLERAHSRDRRGAALGIHETLLRRATGLVNRSCEGSSAFPILTEHRHACSWQAMVRWLLDAVQRNNRITMVPGASITQVAQSEGNAVAVTEDGRHFKAPLIVGADGYRSVVRAAIAPEQPEARYAGYLLWRGMVSEADLPPGTPLAQGNVGDALISERGFRLTAYPVAGPGRTLDPGQRLISFAWYDARQLALLQHQGCLSQTGGVLRSIGPGKIPDSVLIQLQETAPKIWPEPWCAAIVHALKHRQVFATPVAEYSPTRLHSGRLAILGDAAHVVSPTTGRGFVAGVRDAEALAEGLARCWRSPGNNLHLALGEYEARRLAAAQSLAAQSVQRSQTYLQEVARASKRGFEQGLHRDAP